MNDKLAEYVLGLPATVKVALSEAASRDAAWGVWADGRPCWGLLFTGDRPGVVNVPCDPSLIMELARTTAGAGHVGAFTTTDPITWFVHVRRLPQMQGQAEISAHAPTLLEASIRLLAAVMESAS